MKRNQWHNKGAGAWVLAGVTSLLLATTALGQYSVTQPNGIIIPDNPLLPIDYPQELSISNLVGRISKVTVSLNNVKHSYVSDLSALLVYKDTNNVSGSVVLMSAAGGSSQLNGVNITFDDSGSTLPEFTQIGAGPYQPTDYAHVNFPSPAPAGPYGTSLTNAFQGKYPDGKWSLYLYDAAPVSAGQISSWTVNVWTFPVIGTTNSAIAINQNSSGTYYFTVNSATTDPANLTVTAKSGDTNVVTDANLVVGGSGQNRTLTITPTTNKLNPVTVTITVSDIGGSATTNVAVTITPVNQPPSIALSTNTVYTSAGVITSQLTATVADFDNSANELTVQVTSSDDSIVSSNNVFFASTTAAARNFTVVPTGAASGTATLTFKVSDPDNASATTTLVVNVAPQTHLQYANTKVLGFSASGTTNSSIVVSNIPGKIGSATVALTGLKSMRPSITDIALVAPGGGVYLLNSAVAGPNDYARIRFVAGTTTDVPAASSINEESVGVAGLASLNNTSANGTWTLWVTNGGASGLLQGGWVLDLHTGPSIATSITNVVMNAETQTSANFSIIDLDGTVTNASDVTVTSGNASIVTATRTYDVNSKAGTVTFNAPGPNFGSTIVTLTAKDNQNFTASFVFNVTVNFVNHAPTISFIGRVVTRAGTPASTSFTMGDIDLPYTNQVISVTARSSDQKLIPDSNLLFTPLTGLTRTLTMYPLGTNIGTATISVIASDGLSTTTTNFSFVVQIPGNPLYANLAQVTLFSQSAASPYPSTLNVSGLVGKVADVEVTLFGINNDIPDDMNVMLVSPNAKTNILLMSHVGGANALTGGNTILTFSDTATGFLPDTAQITTGTYKPTANGSLPTFPAPAPAPHEAPLAAFAGLNDTNLNGAWNLFIVDDGPGRGVIANGWQLSIRTAPSIQPIAPVTIPEQPDNPATTEIPISIGDDQPGVSITVTANNGNPAGFITTAVTGTGGTRILKITPVPYKASSNIIVTVTAQSDLGAPSTTTFPVTVYHVNLPPVISAISGITNTATQFGTTTFKVWDPQGASALLPPTATSDNKRLIPDQNITIVPQGTSNGTNTYQLTVLPADVQTGTAKITVESTDNVGQKANTSFFVQVNQAPVFINGDGAILIPEGAPVAANATPYPSRTTVSGLDGYVTGVEVTLLGLTHPIPADIDILLVSPDNKATILLASAGDSTPVLSSRISIADDGTTLHATDPLVNFGRYAPASFTAGLDFGVPNVSSSSYKTNLAALTGTSTHPNGDWSLYVQDSVYPFGGAISGWILTLKTSPAFAPGSVADRQTLENTTLAVPITVVSQTTDPASLNVYASAGVSSPTNLPNFNLVSSLQITNNGGGNRTLIITPTPNLPSSVTNVNGSVPILLQVVDGTITNTASFNLTVLWSNQPPVIVASTNNLYLSENPISGTQSSVEVTFTLSDVDSTLFTSNAVARFADSNLVPNSTNNILVTPSAATINQGATGTVVVKLTPASSVSGTNNLSLTMTDGTATSVSVVTLNVKSLYQPPFFSGLAASYNSPAGLAAGPYNFTVGSVENVDPNLLLLSASSGNQGLVPNVNITLGGSGASRSITLLPIGTISGSSTISMTLIDPVGLKTNTTTFALNVTAPPAGLFGNPQVVTVIGNPTNAPSWTYPIVLNVTNIAGPIDNVSLEMRGYSNSSPTSLDALLVAPDQTAVMLVSGGGGTDAVNDLTLAFDDSGIEMPTVGPLASGVYHPSYYTKRVLPNSPATPTTPPTTNTYQARMRAFQGKTVYQGDWKLYLNQQAYGTFAKFSGGIFLKITPAPQIVVTNPSIALVENARDTLYFNVEDSLVLYGSNLTVTASSDNTALLPVGTPTSPQTNNTFQLPLNPSSYASGVAHVTLIATRKSDNVSSSFVVSVTVAAKNFPPTISRLVPVSTPANTPASIQFLVFDPDTPINVPTNMMVEAFSDNPALLDTTNFIFAASGSNIVKGLPLGPVQGTSELFLTMRPNQYVIGSANVTIRVTDSLPVGTNVVSSNFVFTAENRIFPPYIGTVPDQSVIAGRSTAPISFVAGSPNVEPSGLLVTGVSSDQTLVRNSGIVVTPSQVSTNVSNWSVVITALPQIGGFTPKSAAITLTVTDVTHNRTTSTNFNVTVLPPPVYVFATTNSIDIVDNSKANPYPSQITVAGLVGDVSKVTATLNGFSHRFPADANILLVGPGGTNKVVLMNKAGGNTAIPPTNSVTLTFDMSAPTFVPQGSPLATQSYKPANYDPAYNFPDVAPGPYSIDLAVFNGSQANGNWSLYVVDTVQPDAGAIQGWSLSIETKPVLTLSTNLLVMNMNTTNSVGISIQDDAPPGNYLFGTTSTNSTLIPPSGVTFSGSGQKYTATVQPAVNQYGTNELTIWATNILNQFVSTKLAVDVLLVTNPPVIIPLATQNIIQAQIGNADFAFGDALVPQNLLIVTFASSNPSLIPASNISLASPLSTSVGLATNKLAFLPVGIQTGTANITVTVAQPANRGGLSTSSTFTLNVLTSPTPVFANNASIVINDRAPASPYPSTINVPSLDGKVASVALDINGLSHTFPADISMMLVGPRGQKVVLMSRAGDNAALTGVNFRFNQTATSPIPQNSAILTGTEYQPGNYNGALVFYDGPPAGPIVTNLNAFAGTDPTGIWSLYVQDDQSPDSGMIANGWTLRIVTTAPTISSVPPQVTPENTTRQVPISVNSPVVASSNLTVTASSSGSSPSNLIASVTVTMNATNKSVGNVTIVPTADLPSAVTTNDGTSTITVTVTDGTNSASTTFPLTVLYVNQPPTFVGLHNLTTPANQAVSQTFTLTDPDSPSRDVVLLAFSNSDTNLGTVTVTVADTYIVNFVPSGGVGITTVSLVATDGARFTTNLFTINVIPGAPPVIAEVQDFTVAEGTTNATLTAQLSISNSTPDMTVNGISSNPDLATVKISGTGANWTAVVTVAPYVSGEAVIGVTASTEFGNANRSFKVTVTAVNYPPSIAAVQPQSTTANIPLTVPLVITDPDTPLSQLVVAAVSSDTVLVPSIVIANNGTNVSATLNVAECKIGTATITVTATDNATTVTNQFLLTVVAPQPPVIAPIEDITNTNTDLTVLSVPVEITSPVKPLSALTITGSSSNTNLVSGVLITVTGEDVAANLALVSGKKGVSTITITVNDCITTVTNSFKYIVPVPVPATMTATVTNGVLTINITGGPGTTYTIQNSIDLVTWTDVATVTADANGKASYTVNLSGKPNLGFYRTVIE